MSGGARINIRPAAIRDIPAVHRLLGQVLEIHAAIHPDIFISGTRKYTDEELREIFENDETPVFVAVDDADLVKGYCFCILQESKGTNCTYPQKTLYIDDLCVDETARGQHVGQALLTFVKAFAVRVGCNRMTLNVWAGNDSARAFYDAMGFAPQRTTMELPLK